LRCRRCGNENAEGNRFCGMCGAALLAPDAGPDAGASTGPVITGPSFLGLNTPAGQTSQGRTGLRSDRVPGAHADAGRDALRPSSNVDYLLEDEEEPRRGAGKVILVVVALGLAVGFGYLHWKQGGFDWLNAGDKKPPAATTQASDSGQRGGDSAGTPAPTATPQAGAGGAGMAPAASPTASPEATPGAQSTPPQTSPQATPAESPSTQSPPESTNQPSAAPTNAADSSTPASGTQAAGAGSDEQSPAAEPSPEQRAVARKPTAAKLPPAKAVDSVSEAERYIYGRGVREDCDRGLEMLKGAAEQSNAKAMISLGGLYSTGTCAPRDLPTAYRWFALALHKEPDNQTLQDDLQKLWSQMTQPERQLAIRLSQ
jgi:zinc-ribbon domain